MFPISHISTKKARSISGKESRNPKSTWSMAVAAQRVASRNTKQMFTVESDAAFLRAVRKRLKSIPEPHSQVTLIFVNIGLTRSGESRYLKGRQEDVWRGGDTTWLRHGKNCELLESNRTPFLLTAVFRVACVLQSLLNLSSRRDCLILVDDYLDRPQYHAVEEFTDIHAVHGRMAVMAKKGKIRRGRLSTKLVEYQRDWR